MPRSFPAARAATLAVMILSGSRALHPQASEPASAVISHALTWYFHWMKPLPKTPILNCRAAKIGNEYRVLCDPGGVTLELEASRTDANPKVIFVGARGDDFTDELRLFRKQSDNGLAEVDFLVSLSAEEVGRNEPDSGISKAWMNIAAEEVKGYVGLAETHGHRLHLLFPLVSKADPFYQVYATEAGRVDSVWEFAVVDGKPLDYAHWVYDKPHRNIPETAQANADEPLRWYSISAESGK